MFSEYKDIVSELKVENAHFHKLFERHNHLDDNVHKAESGGVDHIDHFEIEKMKKEKLRLKDELYTMIIEHKKNH